MGRMVAENGWGCKSAVDGVPVAGGPGGDAV